MATYAIVEKGLVVNTIMWDGNTKNWAPEEGQEAVLIGPDVIAGIGFSYADGVFTPPPAEETPQVNFAQQAADYMVTVRAIREQVLNRMAGIGVTALVQGDTVTAEGVVAARAALLDITTAPTVVAAKDLPALRAAVTAYYRKAVAAAPETVRKAFNAADV